MHGLRSEARSLADAVVEGCQGLGGREVMLAPPYTSLVEVTAAAVGSEVGVGAQDMYWENSGAFTGEVSGAMLKDVGCSHVIIGHSERRQLFGSTDYTVAKKTSAALAAGLTPVVCVGESLEQREEGKTMDVVARQVAGGLCEVPRDCFDRLVIAYEPVWAIGTGKTASPEQAEEVHAHIRTVLAEVTENQAISDIIRIIYGGSVKPANVDELMACPNIDGALVGGASLNADDFLRIVHYEESR